MESEKPTKTVYEIGVICPPSEVSRQFIQGMADRMTVSYHKYGKVSDAYPLNVNALDSLIQRLSKYKETSNTEFLIDAANFAMIEFMCPSLPGAYFEGTDSDASPGRTTISGKITADSNNEMSLGGFKKKTTRDGD